MLLIRAAQYLRMSTEHQQYSLDNQAAEIREYAENHGFAVVQSYVDAGRTGVVLKNRLGLQQLLADVEGGKTGYKAVLVYDVSRWGRFQDTDEAAHYEFLCKRAGIPVYYCAEQFANDGTLPSAILKALKRAMAAEYSRELGVKCYAGQKRLAQLGFRVGGQAGYGLRRMMVSSDGRRKQKLEPGEYKNLKTDRVILVPGPRREVKCVREIYALALRKRFSVIVRDLNARGVPFLNGRPWTYSGVYKLLTNPKYCGCNTWARTSQQLRGGTRVTDPQGWVMKPRAFTAIVDQELFDRVQVAHRKRSTPTSNEELLRKLKRLFVAKGRLSEPIMAKARSVPSKSTYVHRFGSIRRAYELVGYRLSHRQLAVSEHYERTKNLREKLLAQIEGMFLDRVKRCSLRNHRPALRLDDSLTASVLIARHYVNPRQKQVRWELIPRPAEGDMVTLLCLSNPGYDAFHSFYVMPGMNITTEYQIKGETDPWLQRGRQLHTLAEFCRATRMAAQRLPGRVEIAPTKRRAPRKTGPAQPARRIQDS